MSDGCGPSSPRPPPAAVRTGPPAAGLPGRSSTQCPTVAVHQGGAAFPLSIGGGRPEPPRRGWRRCCCVSSLGRGGGACSTWNITGTGASLAASAGAILPEPPRVTGFRRGRVPFASTAPCSTWNPFRPRPAYERPTAEWTAWSRVTHWYPRGTLCKPPMSARSPTTIAVKGAQRCACGLWPDRISCARVDHDPC
jgi:hypothetical protein